MGTKRRLADIPMPTPDQPFLTRLEACQFARVGTSTFDKAVADKRIKVRWNGKRIVVERVEMIRFIESLPTDRPEGAFKAPGARAPGIVQKSSK